MPSSVGFRATCLASWACSRRTRSPPVRQRFHSRGSCYGTNTLGLKSTLLIFFGFRRSSSGSSKGPSMGRNEPAREEGQVAEGLARIPWPSHTGRRSVVGWLVSHAIGFWAGSTFRGPSRRGLGSAGDRRKAAGTALDSLSELTEPSAAHAFGGRDRKWGGGHSDQQGHKPDANCHDGR